MTFRVLFACVGNSARSVMAQGFARHYGGAAVEARSGGSRPLGRLLPEAIAVMREKGIDVSGERSKGFDEAWIRDQCDLVVTMGCGDVVRIGARLVEGGALDADACPAFVGKRMVDWDLEDPKGKDLAAFRRIRDDVERRVLALLRERGLASP